ncbi:fimbrial protein [Caballeronia sp. LZ008]|uniref:fimbrial protein n=1 Tax=unclassified Caballeronia TaxID=2646786 RepID=UPI002028B0A5|nr:MULTISPECIES: fimbrial protein [unclassified Caballeronia]MDR5796374.1 fimbrial protein [Caballeronia sp. LZ008]
MKTLKLFFAICALNGAGSTLAADATLNFTGNIIFPTCTVDAASKTKTINLGTVKTTDFQQSVGATLSPQAFNLQLTGCATGTNVSMTVNGTQDTVNSVLKNTAGTATQVGVQLLKAAQSGGTTGTAITLGATTGAGTPDGAGNLTIPMVAQYYRLGTLTGGTVSATATVDFTYN